jgi:hypothetical protein
MTFGTAGGEAAYALFCHVRQAQERRQKKTAAKGRGFTKRVLL